MFVTDYRKVLAAIPVVLVLFYVHGLPASEPPPETARPAPLEAGENAVPEEEPVSNTPFRLGPPGTDDWIWDRDAKNYIREIIEVCGIIFDTRITRHNSKLDESALRGVSGKRATYLYFGQPYPDHVFTGIIYGAFRQKFSYPPESLKGHNACVFGKIHRYRGKPAMGLSGPHQIAAEKIESFDASR